MTLQQLKYVLAVAKYKSISLAAEKVFISQPSLTSAIHDLENELGIAIFIRTNKGVSLTNEGDEFLGYARQVVEQASILEEKYINKAHHSPRFSVSCQHYSFAVNAFVDVIKESGGDSYDFTIRETQTNEIIDDVSKMKSEIGILYLNKKNEEVLMKLLKKNDLTCSVLFEAKPHIFISSSNPLSSKEIIKLQDLENYPYLTYEQGDYNSVYFAEEPIPDIDHKFNIKVRDRATLFNLLIGLNGYTVCSGVINAELNGETIIAKPLLVDDYMKIITITKKNAILSSYGKLYLEKLKEHI